MSTALQFSDRTLDPITRQHLTALIVDGHHIRLPYQIEPVEYPRVKTILQLLGGTWSIRRQAFEFPADPTGALRATIDAGMVPLHPDQVTSFVRTPDYWAEVMCGYPYTDLRHLPDGARVLEPSAGDGSLVTAILDANRDVTVTAVEPDPGRAAALTGIAGADVVAARFEDAAAAWTADQTRFDAVVMNPPFSAHRGNPALWADHLQLAWSLLKPGARLVSVVPDSLTYRTDPHTTAVRALIAEHGHSEPLPPRTFASTGGNPRARLVWLMRPLPETDVNPYLWRDYTGTETATRVATPCPTGEAVTAAPVQIWYDPWQYRDRLFRFRARCVHCGWLCWAADDGDNDPLGVLGACTAYPALYSADGWPVGLCYSCANTCQHLDAARATAATLTRTAGQQP